MIFYLKNISLLQCARTFINLMVRISKEQTVRYVLTAVDDMLTEDPQRTSIFFEYAKKTRSSPWDGFINLLNRQDKFIVHQVKFLSENIYYMNDNGTQHIVHTF